MQMVEARRRLADAPRIYRNRPNPRIHDQEGSTCAPDAVYVVGNDPRVHERVSACFETSTTRIFRFRSGQEYLAFSYEDGSACVMIDSYLPDMSGLELQSKASSRAARPVIFISDQCDVPLAVCAMKAGAIDFLSKPLDRSALVAAIQAGLAMDRKARQRKAELALLERRLNELTPREREVLPLVIGGLLNKQAAAILGISEVTLQIHRSQVMRKMQAGSLAELVRISSKLRIQHWRENPGIGKSSQCRANQTSPRSYAVEGKKKAVTVMVKDGQSMRSRGVGLSGVAGG